ncbi:MAG: carboxypeptidase regulatory-like domain-containing protein [Holophagales bacterium]|nr:carboxypeptidase regulatory-like domain-containing protein [Holophagales bacterium]MYG31021.1 carboxypeptidase regulatory-like domain-containing protein [Holophagales bacterium]MYI80145.1 carboxypeptidase regulatory-like domain-containing protein [Holophagales bacterium]
MGVSGFRTEVPSVPENTSHPKEAEEVEILAAPVQMWQDVPQSLLPRKRGRGSVRIFRTNDELWRVRAIRDRLVSAWHDVRSDEASVRLSLLPQVSYSVGVRGDGKALAGARVSLVERSMSGPLVAAKLLAFEVVDNEGRLELVLPAGASPGVIVSSFGRMAAAYSTVDALPTTVQLPPGLTVTGRVLTEEDDPAEGIRFRGDSWVEDGFGLMQRHTGLSDREGRFVVSGFSPGPAALRTVDREFGFGMTFDLQASVDLGDVVLSGPESAWLRIRNAVSGVPVPGARVRNAAGEWRETDETGLLRVSLVFGRDVLVVADGYVLTQFDLPERGGLTSAEALRVALEPAFVVAGSFVAADGHTPAEDGRAMIRDQEEAVTRQELIGHDGSFTFDLHAGSYAIELSAANAGLRRLTVSGSAGEIADLGVVAAPAAGWVSGKVVDPVFSPVPGASVSYTPPSEAGPILAWALGRTIAATTDREGYFELHGLAAGRATIRVDARGYAPAEFEATVDSTEWVDAGFVELSRGRRVTVRSDVGSGIVELDVGGRRHPRDLVTAPLVDGMAQLDGVPHDPFYLRVLADGTAVCERREAEGRNDEVVVCNDSSVAVDGRVTMAGEPGDGMLLWQQRDRDGQRTPEGVIRSGAGPLQRTEVVSSRKQELQAMLDAGGRYHLSTVLPGDWDVIWVPLRGGPREARQIEISDSARRATVDIQFDGVSVEGVVLDSQYQPASLATVDVYPVGSSVVTDQDGRFQVLGLDPGVYQLRARLRQWRSPLVETELRQIGDSESVELVLQDDPPEDELRISIRGASSGFCFVEGNSLSLKVREIDAGTAVVNLSPPHPERLRIACRADGHWILDSWRSAQAAMERGVELDASRSQSGIALVGETAPVAIRIIGPGGWDLGLLRQWFGGDSRFRVGESVGRLPSGEYRVRWRDRAQNVLIPHRRTLEVEVTDGW